MSETVDGVRIVDMPDLGVFTATSSTVGERAGSGRFSAQALGNGIVGVANIQHYDGGTNNDDALRFRNALASGYKTILVPPGTYTFKSRVVQPGPFFPNPPPCVLFTGLDNINVVAYGATFLIDNALTATPPATPYDGAGTGHVGIMGNCHNISWHGGRFVGNTTGSGTRTNAGMWFYCVSGVLVEDTEWLGEWRNGPFNGVWMFDCTFRNNRDYGSGLCWDFAYVENLLLEGNRCEGGVGYASNVGSCCFKLFADTNTYQFNTSGSTYAQVTWLSTGGVRQLRTDKISNNIRLIGNTFNGWSTGIAVDGVDGFSVCENTIRDGAYYAPPNASGITIQTSDQTVAFGAVTRNIFIHDNDIYANGGPGVQIAPHATAGVGSIEIVSNRIYDNNCINAVTWLNNILEIANFRLVGNDFASRIGSTIQQNPYDLSAVRAISGGYVRQNIGVTPHDQVGVFHTVGFNPLSTFPDRHIGTPRLHLQPDNNLVMISTNAAGADRALWSCFTLNDTAPLIFNVPISGPPSAPLVIDGSVVAQLGGGSSASVSVSDTTNYAGMFFIGGGGLGFGPTASTGVPGTAWARFDSSGNLSPHLAPAGSDAAAASSGVPIGALYQNAGVVHVRLT